MSKKELLFSYHGRISIRQFWLGKGLVFAFTLAGLMIWGVFSPVAYSWELGLPPGEHWAMDTLMTASLANPRFRRDGVHEFRRDG